MKFSASLTTALFGCAALVSAAPLSVVVYTKTNGEQATRPFFRVGHAGAASFKGQPQLRQLEAEEAAEGGAVPNVPVFHILPFVPEGAPTPPWAPQGMPHAKKPCPGKSIKLSNWFRQVLGMPTIAPGAPKVGHHFDELHVDPHGRHAIKFHAVPLDVPPARPVEHPEDERRPHHYHHHRPHHGAGAHHHHRRPFSHRLQMALMTLGPWEGRLVAFVLGCGIGVLLRLVWVLAVITFRSFRRDTEEDDVDMDEEEEYLLPPPEYTEEKIAQLHAVAEHRL
ncbi:hypothetical protein AURDEDRAFT_149131 [Auricularia subglabra TFB-10046 SS5]|nr:hypothetical protein AURDEDRAFT_149131 [Auricularia subglabra TFB-10046 SS5]